MTYRNDLIKKKKDLQKKKKKSVFFAPIACFPQKWPTEICSFLFFGVP